MEYDKKICPVVDVDGVIATGKQFDLDITLPKDNRNVIYGIIKDCYKEPVRDAVVKLIEVVCECGKEERRPVSHTFTDENGELLYGESHILCNLFSVGAIERMGANPLPYHVAYKKAKYIDKKGDLVEPESPNAYKFEAFLFDAFGEVDEMAVLRVKREEEFAPVKNADSAGVDCPRTARELYKKFYNLD